MKLNPLPLAEAIHRGLAARVLATKWNISCFGICLWGVAILSCSLSRANDSPVTERTVKTLHMLLIFDDQAKFAEETGIIKDHENWTKTFGTIANNLGLKDGSDYTLTILHGADVTPDAIRQYYRSIRVRPQEDGLVFLYCGHGLQVGQHHVLELHGHRYIARSEIKDMMLSKNGALTVLITDSCGTTSQSLANIADLPNQPKGQRMCQSLFYHHRGVVDINSSKMGEVAYGHASIGGNFSHAFRRLLYGAEMNDPGVQRTLATISAQDSWQDITWGQFTKLVTNELATISRDFGLSPQEPHIFQLPGGYMGVQCRELSDEGKPRGIHGLLIQSVATESPATEAGLRGFEIRSVDDISASLIVEINGYPIRKNRDFTQVIDRCDGLVKLKLLDPITQSEKNVSMTLLPRTNQ